jgi:hypothetical protein
VRSALCALLALGVLPLCACHRSSPASSAGALTGPALTATVSTLEKALDALDGQIAGAYGAKATAAPSSRPVAMEWPVPVGAMVATERTVLDFTKAEALAKKCGFTEDSVTALRQGAMQISDSALVRLGYRSSADVALTRTAELAEMAETLKHTSSADCAVQESRVQATASLATSLSAPKAALSGQSATDATLHRDILRLSKLTEVADHCAVSEDTATLLTGLEHNTEALALKAGTAPAFLPLWRKEGSSLGQYAFSAWPSVDCDEFRRAFKATLPIRGALLEALQSLTTQTGG